MAGHFTRGRVRGYEVAPIVWVDLGSSDLPQWEFDDDKALAVLLAVEVVFTNTNWSEKGWPQEARQSTALYVCCSDIFAFGCADGEAIDHDQIRDLYEHWEKDPEWGPAVWCIRKRGVPPQAPVAARIRAAGIWNLDALLPTPAPADTEEA